jgi:hypothetical protein
MITTELQELNEAQKFIYTRTNIRRAFPEFDDTDVTGIYLIDDFCRIVYKDGAQVDYQRQLIKDAFISFSSRLKDFFAYLGPNYRGPSIWHQNAYIMFKGWNYMHSLGHTTMNAKLQAKWADKFTRLTSIEKLTALLQSNQTDLGHLVAPDGLRLLDQTIDLNAETDDNVEPKETMGKPMCSCGSFQRQVNNLELLQQELPGYEPTCIHLVWF